ncbi:sulfurtransferase [Microbacterium sp. NPDC056234]|uniref:sulfurtransferase n=1 Tax=Microbacterium sp. NPDC056234 TaxID=3345757 RepID=UPI0035D5E9C3
MTNLVSPAQLIHLQRRAEHGEGPPVRVLDVRWRLDRPEGRPEYVRAHLPDAVYVDLEHELADRGQPERGRHPLPSLERLQSAARGWGLNADHIAVAYDDNRGVAAARLWWLLRRAGVDVRLLDGGIRGWIAEGLPLDAGDVLPEPGDVVLFGSDDGRLELGEVEAFTRSGVLLDVRTPEQYSGTQTSLDPVGGHIPGAVNLPAMAVVDGDGRLRHPDALRRIFGSVGIRPDTQVAVYCGSGVAAMHTALALDQAGIRAAVYPGSWSEWSNHRGLPVAIGILPNGRVTAV